MLLTVREMEMLCVYHDGTRATTVALMRGAASEARDKARGLELRELADKLDAAPEGDTACLALA